MPDRRRPMHQRKSPAPAREWPQIAAWPLLLPHVGQPRRPSPPPDSSLATAASPVGHRPRVHGDCGRHGGPARAAEGRHHPGERQDPTVDSGFSIAEAVACANGRVHGRRVRTTTSVSSQDRSTRMIDLAGRHVVPGLIGQHLHSAGGGPGVDLSRRAIDRRGDLRAVLRAYRAGRARRDRGVEQRLARGAAARNSGCRSRDDLDQVAPATPGRAGSRRSRIHRQFRGARAVEDRRAARREPRAAASPAIRMAGSTASWWTRPRAWSRCRRRRARDARRADRRSPRRIPEAACRRADDGPAPGHLDRRLSAAAGDAAPRRPDHARACAAAPDGDARGASCARSTSRASRWTRATNGCGSAASSSAVDGGFEGGLMRDLYEQPFDEGGTFEACRPSIPRRSSKSVRDAQPPRLARGDARGRRCRDRSRARRVRSGEPRPLDRRAALDDRACVHRPPRSSAADEDARRRHLGAEPPVSGRPEPGEVLGLASAPR